MHKIEQHEAEKDGQGFGIAAEVAWITSRQDEERPADPDDDDTTSTEGNTS